VQLPIVAVGTQDAFNAIQTDPQLANRFEPAVLHRWTMGEDYLRLLASFEMALPLEHRSGFLEPAMAIKILSLSEGTIGEISSLLCRAAIDAIESGTEQIMIASLEHCGYVAPSQRPCLDDRERLRQGALVVCRLLLGGPVNHVALSRVRRKPLPQRHNSPMPVC
jgi:hypothetical protein